MFAANEHEAAGVRSTAYGQTDISQKTFLESDPSKRSVIIPDPSEEQ